MMLSHVSGIAAKSVRKLDISSRSDTVQLSGEASADGKPALKPRKYPPDDPGSANIQVLLS